MSKMKEIIQEVKEINQLDPTSEDLRFTKTLEEWGELVQAINMSLGRKKTDLDKSQMLDLILEESADTVQCLLSWADTLGIKMSSDSNGYNFSTMEVAEVTQEVRQMQYLLADLSKNPNATLFCEAIQQVSLIAYMYGFEFFQILIKIREKNKKWRNLVIQKSKNEHHREAAQKVLDNINSMTSEQRRFIGGSVSDLEDLSKRIIELTS